MLFKFKPYPKPVVAHSTPHSRTSSVYSRGTTRFLDDVSVPYLISRFLSEEKKKEKFQFRPLQRRDDDSHGKKH